MQVEKLRCREVSTFFQVILLGLSWDLTTGILVPELCNHYSQALEPQPSSSSHSGLSFHQLLSGMVDELHASG